jgi:hypothetical protein
MADGMKRDWRELCAAVTNESDSTKLSSLIRELVEALDRGERSWVSPFDSRTLIVAKQLKEPTMR